ncbi:MAG TPA: DUF1549 domain-containing protein [Gemmataceae bacterium]|jgi:hypothetical protein|nr:DUF1549 domain-containing protein [Gemmataceae bacterium]
MPWRRLFYFSFLFALSSARAEITSPTTRITLPDAYAGHQLVVAGGDRDVTREVKFTSTDPAIARVDATGYVNAVGNGSTTIHVQHTLGKLDIPVTVSGVGNGGRAVDFRTEVVPLLSKLGCNAGGCHGKASGQNGFKLSLFGFDTEFDYAAIVREARGRRVFAAAPDQSLFLLKASGQTPHGGGKRLRPDSSDFQVVRQWIAAGAPASASDVPIVKRLRVFPTDGVLKREQQQQVAVLAEYSDGSVRDVTRQSEFASNLDVVASVDATGLVQTHQLSGEAAIMARHMGHMAVFRAMVPHGETLTAIPEFKPINYVDDLALAKWKKLGLRPSPVVDDATFLRRATVDLCGRLPTLAEVQAFADDKAADKRTKLIDRLLDSPDYPAYFALRWGSILRNSNLAGADQAAYAFHGWIKDMIARNRPYDEFVRGIVAAAGEWQDAPAINWYWQNRDDQLHQVTADVAQVFLGVRLQCAKCHHHPYERWGQADYYGLAGFFTRLGRKSFGQPPPYFASASVTSGDKDPLTGKTPEPKYPDGLSPKFTPEDDPRHALVDWMAKPDNPFFARALVNRLWGHLLGRGLYHEVDDQRDSNPPSNPELLDALAKDFVAHKFDVKHMLRTIATSRLYQLSAEPTDGNKDDRQNFARYYARRMPAEVFLDAVNQATLTKTGFSGLGTNSRAVDLPHEGFGSYFLDTFDRPKRVTVCECERSTGATLSQVLLLANSEEIEGKIGAGDGRIAKLVKEKKPANEAVAQLFVATLSRLPSDSEKNKTLAYYDQQPNKQQALEDILWALLNSKEFMFNH